MHVCTCVQHECAVSIDKHIAIKPNHLKLCGHIVCEQCLPKDDGQFVKCILCNEANNKKIKKLSPERKDIQNDTPNENLTILNSESKLLLQQLNSLYKNLNDINSINKYSNFFFF